MINAGMQTCAAYEEECGSSASSSSSSSSRVCVQGNSQIEIDLAVEIFNLGSYFFLFYVFC